MPITGRFLADFESFYAAVQKADVSLRGLETGAGKVGTSLNKMVDSFSGRKIIQDATLAAEAVERIGGTTKLTTAELQRLGAQATEAAAKLKALGVDVPPGIQKIAAAAKEVEASTSKMAAPAAAAGLSFKTLFSSFTAAGVATQLIGKLTAEVSKLFDAGMRLPAIEQGFKRLNASVGQNSQEMLGSLQTATKGMVTELDLMQSANKALLLGLPVTKESMGELATAATALGRAMGMDATKSLDDLITALGRSSPMILDNLGLTVKVGEANEVYAAKLGKTAEQLTDAEKKIAFYEAAMEAARKKTKELGDQSKTLGEIITTVWTSISNSVTRGVGEFNVGLGRMLSSWQKFKQAIDGSQGAGLGGAILAAAAQEAAAAEEAVRKVKAASRRDINLELDVDPLIAYRKELEAIRVAVSKLTPEQKSLITESQKYGKTTEEIAKALGLSKTAVDGFIKSLSEQKRQTKDVEKATKELEAELDKAAAAGVKGFKDWHAAMDDLNWDMRILVATRLKDLGDQSKKVLSEATAGTAALIKLLRDGLPVVEGLGDGLENIGKQVKIVVPEFEKVDDGLQRIAQSFAQLAQVSSGTFGGIVQEIAVLVSAMDMAEKSGQQLKDALTGSEKSVVGAVVGAIGAVTAVAQATDPNQSGGRGAGAARGALAGAQAGMAFGPYGAAIGAVVGAMVGFVRAMGKGRNAVEDFAKAAGGFDALHTQLQVLGDEGERLWQSLTQGVGRNNPEQAKAVIGEVSAALGRVPGELNAMITAALTAGAGIDQAMAPLLENLIRTGQLTQENANLLMGLPAAGVPAFSEVASAAERLGLNIDSIGQGIKQMGFTEAASSVARDLDILARAGADMEAVLTGSRDKIQKLVNDAQKFGLSLPESIKQFLQQMVDGGKLTDIFGDKLSDLEDLHFTKPLEQSVDDLVEAMRELVGVIKDEVGGAFDDLGRKIVRPKVIPDYGGLGSIPKSEGPGGPPSNADDRSRITDDGTTPPGPPGRKAPSVAELAAAMGRVLPFPSPALTAAEAALTASRPAAGSQASAAGSTMTIILEQDGQKSAEFIVPYIPDAVKRYGLA